jgi:phage tail-like protein
MLDSSGASEALRWNLLNAWPQEWYGAPLATMSHEVAVETLVLAHDGLQRESGNGGAAAA